ncbi:hypothetical protein EMEDMD4_420041 [Sinorhizobium medicae]|uniref:Uncharacterized protein n=1 Tax=Sinorhizobium medicae TaxID=110321 RepID=A0A508WW18_9HYPH|nr:hypothetical protein EMEDMD4_1390002 [Sinorhizobium medicae]VTZ62602.1 hypothetical protein EMEDMD4_420041 [Sinorhizobium medicae]
MLNASLLQAADAARMPDEGRKTRLLVALHKNGASLAAIAEITMDNRKRRTGSGVVFDLKQGVRAHVLPVLRVEPCNDGSVAHCG